jgi:hypothetical protein
LTTIRIHAGQVRNSGVAAVTCGDDLTAQAAALRGLPMPDMPGAMAAKYTSALSGVASTLTSLASQYGTVGEELQLRAVAAEVADAPGDVANAAAGGTLARSVTTTIAAPGGARTAVRVTAGQTGTVAQTSTGARVTTPDTVERPAVAASASTAAPDPQADPHGQPTASRDVTGQQQVGGAPAVAVHQALAAGSSESGPATASGNQSYTVDPSQMPAGEHRAEHVALGGAGGAGGGGGGGHGVPAPADMPHAHDADRQHWACWMAGSAAHEGLPPALPVMMALARGGLRNMPSGESDAGFFGIDPQSSFAPAGAGVAPGAHQPGEWWVDHPDAQLDHVIARLSGAGGGIRTGALDDPEALGRWASEAVPGVDAAQFGDAHTAANELLSHCRMEHAAVAAPSAGGPLAVAKGQLGVHEVGNNTGPQVNKFLASADVGPGNPWCAAFVTWSVEHSGHDMPGTGWAAVSNWVNAAEAGQHGLHIVDAAHARPGDVVAYDWGHGNDFTGDGHIGFLESTVNHNGDFTTVEGNSGDAVQRMDRNLSVANVVFIRLAG